jgi:hypothetical protein
MYHQYPTCERQFLSQKALTLHINSKKQCNKKNVTNPPIILSMVNNVTNDVIYIEANKKATKQFRAIYLTKL